VSIEPRLLRLPDAATYLGVSDRCLRTWTYKRQIPFVKTGEGRSATVLFEIADLDAWIDANKVPARVAS
jgi:excisionase family DNA binding protein